jgi:glycerol-3-phosphate dehydrogenase
LGDNGARNVRLVQGSHIVVRKLYEHDRCYMFQNSDGRIIFAIPYETDYTLIGTTDLDYLGDPKDVRISDAEIDYLTSAASEYFARAVTRDDIVWSYSGVRPLFDDGASSAQEATRDYVLKSTGGDGKAALINVFGGKLTTFRRLAESTLEQVEALIGARGKPWTRRVPLPGGDFPTGGFADLVASLQHRYAFLDAAHATRLARLYGTRAEHILGKARSHADLGRHFGADLYEAEIRYLVDNEWAVTSDDILWRRTKRGLLGSAIATQDLDTFLATLMPRPVAAAG